jgi:aryl-alcohol dehydrogenase-like predicted oxidoreductase
MNTRTLGRTGLRVSELALGGLFVSSFGAPFEQGREATRRALELGVNYVDTAPGYGNSEEVLGRFLEGTTAPVILSTKLGGRPRPFLPQDKAGLRRSVEESLRLLKRDRIDILMIHEPDRPGEYDWWTDLDTFEGPVLELLDELKREGVIGHTGLGGTTAYELARLVRTGRFDVVLTAFNYSLLWREAEREILPAALEHGVGVVIGSPLQQGALARRYDDEIRHGARWLSPPRRAQYRALYDLLDEAGLSLPEAGLRFALSNPHVSCVLMGARSAEEVAQNAAAVERGPLPPDLLARLDEIAARVPFRPFDEPAVLPFGREWRGPGPVR